MADTTTQVEHVHLAASRPVWGVIGALMGVIYAGLVYYLHQVQVDSKTTAGEVERIKENGSQSAQRMMRVETKIESIETGQQQLRQDVNKGLESLGSKLDRMLEQPPRGAPPR